MLSNAPAKAIDLLTLMANTAAQKAASELLGTIRLAKCDSFTLDEGYLADGVDLESWSVFADHQAVVVAVHAIAPHRDGNAPRIAGSGRFTFTTLTHKREYRA